MIASPKLIIPLCSTLVLAAVGLACDPAQGPGPEDGLADETDPEPEASTGEGLFDDADRPDEIAARPDPSAWAFLPWHSEENGGGSECPEGQVVTGFDCSGSYCDNVRIECHDFGTTVDDDGTWSLRFEREHSPGPGAPGSVKRGHVCPSGEKMTGVDCFGNFCDDLSIECTPAPGLNTNRCAWQGPYSEEQSPYYAPFNAAIQGVWCNGTHCDNKWYLECEVE
ncbi:MAG: hypothetical protein AAF799_38385 [Myxococcota bacterium]